MHELYASTLIAIKIFAFSEVFFCNIKAIYKKGIGCTENVYILLKSSKENLVEAPK
jgi:hypothetical protein